MVQARVAEFFSPSEHKANLVDASQQYGREGRLPTLESSRAAMDVKENVQEEVDLDAARPPYLHVRMRRLSQLVWDGNI